MNDNIRNYELFIDPEILLIQKMNINNENVRDDTVSIWIDLESENSPVRQFTLNKLFSVNLMNNNGKLYKHYLSNTWRIILIYFDEINI